MSSIKSSGSDGRASNGLVDRRPLCKLSLLPIAIVVAFGPSAWAGPSDSRLRRLSSRHYTIHTNLAQSDAIVYGRHMDIVYDQYERRFRIFGQRDGERMNLYLLRNQQDYLSFLSSIGVNAINTGGIFFIRPDIKGLATWTQGKPRSKTFAVLQHEGFHQFANRSIGAHLPIWANEGLAQFFEDGIIVRTKMTLGLRNAQRIESVKKAIKFGTAFDFDRMLNMTDAQWHEIVAAGGQSASLLYDQAWSMTYYMVRTKKKRQDAFLQYLLLISKHRNATEAFASVFGQDSSQFREGWRRFSLQVEPDPLATAVSRLEFLGQGLKMLHDRKQRMPSSMNILRSALKRFQFRLQVSQHGIIQKFHAKDDFNYQFRRANGTQGKFRLLKSSDPKIPPRITAQGLNPLPTLVWSKDANGQLVQNIQFR